MVVGVCWLLCHRMTNDSGRSWSTSSMVLSTSMQPGHVPAETIAGKFFPEMGGMVLITDGCSGGGCLHAYVSKQPGSMTDFVASSTPTLTVHPPWSESNVKGSWANSQIAFFTDKHGAVVSVGYTLWGSNPVKSRRSPAFGMSMTVFSLSNITVNATK